CVLGNSPWRAAVSSISLGAVICPAGVLNRCMKSDVRDVYSWPNGYAERLDGTIEVLVIERVFIVPDACAGVRHFKAHEPDAVVSRVRLSPIHRRAGPCHDRWLLAHGGARGAKGEGCGAATEVITLVGSIVSHFG